MNKVSKGIQRVVGVIAVIVIGSIIYQVIVEIFGHGFMTTLVLTAELLLIFKISGLFAWSKKRRADRLKSKTKELER